MPAYAEIDVRKTLWVVKIAHSLGTFHINKYPFTAILTLFLSYYISKLFYHYLRFETSVPTQYW